MELALFYSKIITQLLILECYLEIILPIQSVNCSLHSFPNSEISNWDLFFHKKGLGIIFKLMIFQIVLRTIHKSRQIELLNQGIKYLRCKYITVHINQVDFFGKVVL